MSEVFYTEKARVRASFERAAHSYDAAAALQQEVARRMDERLDYIKVAPKVILDAGSGTGFGSALLRRRYPDARVIELDLAHSMLCESRDKQRREAGMLGRLMGRARPWQVGGDLERLPLATASVDMIWSSLAIQWVNIPDAMFAEFYRVLKPEGMVLFSTLGPDTLMELRQSFEGLDGGTHVNRFIDMHDLGDAMLAGGLAEPVVDMEKIVMTYDTVRDVLRDLKAIGAHNVTQGRNRGMMGKQTWRTLEARYETWRHDGRLPASYEVIYGHAWRGGDRKKPATLSDGRQVIEFVNKSSR
jgi:malonyl-CoA O-methyltransferase